MELKELDKIQEARRIIKGVRDSMVMIENSSVRETQNSIYYMLETALEKAASLLDEAAAEWEATEE